jgi:transposase
MGNPRGVRRDFEALEQRRFAALELFAQDWNNSEIGRQLKVSNQTVSRWRKEFVAGGPPALRQAGRAGRKPQLEAEQRQQLVAALQLGPEAFGYEAPLWTCARVGDVIQQQFGIQYHPGHVWRILRQLNWSPQRPVGRALERNEVAIAEWKRQRWPALKKKPKTKGVRSSSSTKAV